MESLVLSICVFLGSHVIQAQEHQSSGPYLFHPYHQPHYQRYQHHQQQVDSENRRQLRTETPNPPVIQLKKTVSSKHFSSPSYRYQPVRKPSPPRERTYPPERGHHQRAQKFLQQTSDRKYRDPGTTPRKTRKIAHHPLHSKPYASQVFKRPVQQLASVQKVSSSRTYNSIAAPPPQFVIKQAGKGV